MSIYRLLVIFFSIRNTGIFNEIIPGFNPFLKTVFKKKNPALALKICLERLGPVFIKFGQLLSTRTDLLPKNVTRELNLLTDDCAPISFEDITKTITDELRNKSIDILSCIDKKPLASASLAQVHKIKIGKLNCVVKVQKPNLMIQVKRDIRALKIAAKSVKVFLKDYPRINPEIIINDYESVIMKELDFRIEAANAKKTYEKFADNEYLYVPKIIDEYTRKKILIMEYIDGIPITDVSALKKNKVNLKKLSENGVRIFLKQVFEDNFFHADMHPGNIFASKKTPDTPYYYAVDYAICGSVTESNQILLAQMISLLIEKDFFALSQLFIFAGWVNEDTKTEELEAVLRSNCESILDQPLSTILFGELLLNLFDAMKPYDLFLDYDLLLLVKTLIHIEGMGRQIYPELDFWAVANPFLKNWFKERYSVKGLIKYLVSKKHILTYMIIKKIEETQEVYSELNGER